MFDVDFFLLKPSKTGMVKNRSKPRLAEGLEKRWMSWGDRSGQGLNGWLQSREGDLDFTEIYSEEFAFLAKMNVTAVLVTLLHSGSHPFYSYKSSPIPNFCQIPCSD